MTNKEDVLQNCFPNPEQPFPAEEYKARLKRIRERMAKEKIDLLWVGDPASMNYISGYQCEWYQAQSPKQWPGTSGIAIHVDHDHYILFDTIREILITRYCTHSTDTRIFPSTGPKVTRDGTEFIANELKESGWLKGGARVGLELYSYRPTRAISERFEGGFKAAGATIVDGSDVMREVRWVKSPLEVKCLEEAGRIADKGMEAAAAALRVGATELEVYGEMVRGLAAAGGENTGLTMPVLSGKKSNSPHAMSSRKKIEKGDIVIVDLCGVYNRYHLNLARTFSMGEPAKDVREMTRTSLASIDIIRQMIKPNLRVGDLAKALLDYYKKVGIWEERGWIGGYEMGVAMPPDWVGNFVFDLLDEGNHDQKFVPGTCINYENQFFYPRQTGMYFMIESLLFKENGASIVSKFPNDLNVID